MALICGLKHILLTVSCAPCTKFTTPLGNPISLRSYARIVEAPATFSDGFIIYVLPHTTDNGNIHNGIITGKLNGAIPAHTPSGTLKLYVSIFLDIFSTVSPIDSDAVLHVYSTTSNPLITSPLASANVLPYSLVIASANLSILSLIALE